MRMHIMHLLCFVTKRRWLLNLEDILPLHHLMTNTRCLLVTQVILDRGKKVLVSVNKSFMVGDHDFTRNSLTPSVALFIEIPESINGSFYHGQVCVGVKDSVFEASSTYRHTTELNNLLTMQNDSNPMLLLYTDGGPDHRVNFLSVQLSYVALFLTRDLDYLVAVRTPPYNSWKNPAERVCQSLT